VLVSKLQDYMFRLSSMAMMSLYNFVRLCNKVRIATKNSATTAVETVPKENTSCEEQEMDSDLEDFVVPDETSNSSESGHNEGDYDKDINKNEEDSGPNVLLGFLPGHPQ
jgi:hypothetical protein